MKIKDIDMLIESMLVTTNGPWRYDGWKYGGAWTCGDYMRGFVSKYYMGPFDNITFSSRRVHA